MSLAVLADHLSSKGRNGDSMLVHMSPDEVAGLHALALTHGTKLTINPETGLPEAFSLKSLLKSVLPVVAGFALGPAGFGVVSSALGAGALVGGATALATGSLQKGIMAGLGAYGGFGLGAGLESAGMAAAQDQAVKNLTAEQIAEGVARDNLTAQGVRNLAAQQATQDYLKQGFFDRATSGLGALGSEAGRGAFMQGVGGASGLMKAGMAAAAPIMADQAVQTATPMPGTGGFQYTPRIRPMAYDQYTGGLEQLPMFSAVNTGQSGGGMADGGIVALAAGGTPKGAMSPEDFKKMIYAGGADDALATQRGIEYVMNTPGFRPDTATQYWNQALGTKFTEGDYFRVMKELGKDPYYYEKTFVNPPAPVTGGGVTPGSRTTIGGGQPITVSPVKAETIPGYKGEDKTYGGGTIKQYVAPDLGTPGTVKRDTQTMKEIRDEYTRGGGTVAMPTVQDFKPSVTGSSKAAYDYLMGQGPYPVNPTLTTGQPIMRPYLESVGMVQPGFFGRQGASATSGTTSGTTGGTTGATTTDTQTQAGTTIPAGYQLTPGVDPSGNRYTGLAGSYFLANPDVQRAYETEVRNMTPEDYVRFHWTQFGQKEGRPGYVEQMINAAVGNDTTNSFGGSGGGRGFDSDMVMQRAGGGLMDIAAAGAAQGGDVRRYNLGGYSDGGRLLKGPGDGVSDSIPATIGGKQPARLADGEFVIPARIVSEIGNGSTEAGARKLYAMMDRVQRARAKTTGKGKVAKNTRADKYLPA